MNLKGTTAHLHNVHLHSYCVRHELCLILSMIRYAGSTNIGFTINFYI